MADMGIGLLGDPRLIYKRKFRWTFAVNNICGGLSVPPWTVKVAARPSLEGEETEINFLNGVTWIPGKYKWNTMTVNYYDVVITSGATQSSSSGPQNLFTWLRSVYDFGDPVALHMGSSLNDYGGTGVLDLYDGCGNSLETWYLNNMWPQSIDFGTLDMGDSEPCEIELTLRYTSVQFIQNCGVPAPNPCCTGCG